MNVQNHLQEKSDAMKKRYMKPSVIDLSIEGMTGIGYGVFAGNCDGGLGYSGVVCSDGLGFQGSCTGGTSPNLGCTTGMQPYQSTGNYCMAGSSADANCNFGNNATGEKGICTYGSTATLSPGSYCDNGPSDSQMCGTGDTYIPPTPSS